DKMRQGVPLEDADREPWLRRVRDLLAEIASAGGNAVLACSALREQHRRMLGDGVPGITFVMLEASRSVLEQRLEARRGHFAGAAILDRQLEDLEVPPRALIVDA